MYFDGLIWKIFKLFLQKENKSLQQILRKKEKDTNSPLKIKITSVYYLFILCGEQNGSDS